jgi:hypothetical protein
MRTNEHLKLKVTAILIVTVVAKRITPDSVVPLSLIGAGVPPICL